jgi:hypothetical protein
MLGEPCVDWPDAGLVHVRHNHLLDARRRQARIVAVSAMESLGRPIIRTELD